MKIHFKQGWSLSAWSLVAAFGAYFCMYAFRKPFTVGKYTDISMLGIEFKTVLVTAQVFGYMLSKFIGIKFVAEVKPSRRVVHLISLIGLAEFSLFLFGITAAPFNFIWLFSNGIFLGMVFGLVMGFLEGRKHTEAMASGMCVSFIIADGVVKSIGAYILEFGVSQFWMPAVAGMIFFPFLLVFAWMLSQIPSPSVQDIEARSLRTPMDRQERWQFFRKYAIGLVLLVMMYLLITILRSVRADFAPEIWTGLQASVSPNVYSWSEISVAFGVTILNGSAVLIRNNRIGFFFGISLSIAGAILVIFSLLGLHFGFISPFIFMVLHGLGLYLPYIAVHTTIFERMIAMTRDRGNMGYLMYLADSFGYLGYVVVLLARNLFGPVENFLSFFLTLSWIIAGLSIVLLVPCWYYFAHHPSTFNADLKEDLVQSRLKHSIGSTSCP